MTESEEEANAKPSGAPYGCLSAFILVASVGFILLFAYAWGGAHCSPVPACQHSNARRALVELLSLLVVSGLLGFVVSGITRRITAFLDNWATAIVVCLNLAIALLLSWLTFHAFMGHLLSQ